MRRSTFFSALEWTFCAASQSACFASTARPYLATQRHKIKSERGQRAKRRRGRSNAPHNDVAQLAVLRERVLLARGRHAEVRLA
jgi:hypothetical protein